MNTLKNPITFLVQIRKVLGITVLWILIGTGLFWFERSAASSAGCPPPVYNVWSTYFVSLISTLTAGIVGGSVVVFFFEKWIRIWPYWRAAVSILLAFTMVYLFVTAIGFLLYRDVLKLLVETSESSWRRFFLFMLSPDFVRSYIAWFLIVLLTLLGLVVYDKYGPGAMGKILLGKYFKPKTEERVFMFLDLRSSTEIAERLGEQRYFNLLHDVIQDVTTPILIALGEIYQYVGDEIIVTWPTSVAQRNANCLNCFFTIREAVQKRANYYRHTYGMVPEYKAGLHYGNVIAGEIGVVKRDITYSGDVLNTTSRIQAKCNELGVDILFSKHLLDLLHLIPGKYQPRLIGAVSLRGKKQEEMLYTL